MSVAGVPGTELTLDPLIREALAGLHGEGTRLAAQLVVALGQVFEATDLVPVNSVQVAGVSYRNLGSAGLEFLRDWAAKGGRARVLATLNPAGMDLARWAAHGIPETFARQQLEVIDAYELLGILPTCTCTPYLVGNVPACGEHVAWSESSAVAFANSVLGARTNREGGPGALAAAIIGETARYGLHLDEQRRANLVVDVTCRLESQADFAALGYLVGRIAGDGVPLLRLGAAPDALEGEADLLRSRFLPHLMALGAAMASSGAVGLYHIAGVTPEARRGDGPIAPGAVHHRIDHLGPAYAALNTAGEQVDLVSIGCPHATLDELGRLAAYLDGRRVKADLWVTTARPTLEEATRLGLAAVLEAAGARLMADTCLVVAPMAHFHYRVLATNSAKMATYAPGHCGLATHFGTTEACLEAALLGRWPWSC